MLAAAGATPATVTAWRPVLTPSTALAIPSTRRLDARFLLQEDLAAQAHLAGRVDVDHLHQQLLAFLQLVAHVLDAVERDLRDVQQAVERRA